jgi:hypothetical protein
MSAFGRMDKGKEQLLCRIAPADKDSIRHIRYDCRSALEQIYAVTPHPRQVNLG